jgi:hypothetical protein
MVLWKWLWNRHSSASTTAASTTWQLADALPERTGETLQYSRPKKKLNPQLKSEQRRQREPTYPSAPAVNQMPTPKLNQPSQTCPQGYNQNGLYRAPPRAAENVKISTPTSTPKSWLRWRA